MSEQRDPAAGWRRHRDEQERAWARATPARRFAWLEEMLDWLRRRPKPENPDAGRAERHHRRG